MANIDQELQAAKTLSPIPIAYSNMDDLQGLFAQQLFGYIEGTVRRLHAQAPLQPPDNRNHHQQPQSPQRRGGGNALPRVVAIKAVLFREGEITVHIIHASRDGSVPTLDISAAALSNQADNGVLAFRYNQLNNFYTLFNLAAEHEDMGVTFFVDHSSAGLEFVSDVDDDEQDDDDDGGGDVERPQSDGAGADVLDAGGDE
ncbi:hypothetical protein MPSEU_000815900 [Mayamaea pseudoterrestris]|nr:hypothetical protein MPSEU_000815900 [Mayamaea pseudoterrestris]